MDANRQLWNERQQELRAALARPADQQRGLELFLIQHAAMHSSNLSSAGLWSFADEVLEGLGEGALRCILPKGEHSIAWVLWHMTRIEDMTMNVLVAGGNQVFYLENWSERLGVAMTDTGSAMDLPAVAEFSRQVDLSALVDYRLAVGRATQVVIRELPTERLKTPVDPARIERIRAEGGVAAAASWLLDYWGGLTITGLLLMPPTRHIFVHLNEISRIRSKCG